MAEDSYGRHIHYLRISLTDHCNLRCRYCMPEDMTFRPNAELIQDEELFLLVKLFAELGFDKIRLTGGEPTVRANIVPIVRTITQTPGIRSLTMTTNGILLGKLAVPLKEAGLQRANISLDTLNPDLFKKLTRWGSFEQVWQGIEAAEKAGLTPVKINAVVVRGYNEMDVADLAKLTLERDWQVRFIEMMPFGGATDLQKSNVVTTAETITRIENAVGTLKQVNGGEMDGEARIYKIPGARGELGFISSVTMPFCAGCTRVRLTADGKLRLCLLRDKEVDVLTPLRAGLGLDELREMILEGIWHKPWGHGLAEGVIATNRVMSQIGG